jgi:transcriptional regulator with XRE-family HTH domain
MRSNPKARLPLAMRRNFIRLGESLKIARKRRRMAMADVTEAAGISEDTLRRLEAGDPGVSLATFGMVLLALGEQRRLAALLDIATDETGLMVDISRLPKRVRRGKGGPEGL